MDPNQALDRVIGLKKVDFAKTLEDHVAASRRLMMSQIRPVGGALR